MKRAGVYDKEGWRLEEELNLLNTAYSVLNMTDRG